MASILTYLLLSICSDAGGRAQAETFRHAPASVCALCHSNAPAAVAMRDAAGTGIAPFDLWDGTAMANASRDPFFLAVVSVERAATPDAGEVIESLCLRCHAPTREAAQTDDDGVSCTVCHQIAETGLGTPSSFSGGFSFAGTGEIYGPHRDVMPMPMRHHTGFEPTYAAHITRSALCASCHTLFTDALASDGTPVGSILAEQTPYLEWRNSIYNDERGDATDPRGCADCHMPTRDAEGRPLRTEIARNPHGRDFGFTRPRAPYGQHSMLGANRLLPALLAGGSTPADRRSFDEPPAAVEIGVPVTRGRVMTVPVTVRNRTGHKFPTGHPSRRAWLRFVARGTDGEILFASGGFDGRGRLVDGDGRTLEAETVGKRPRDHTDVVRSSSDVVIYEAVMSDGGGRPTYLLLRGTEFAKDNRLLPVGWRADHPEAVTTTPRGVDGDRNFAAGTDVVEYRIKLPRGAEVGVLEADLFYQSWGARYLAEVSRYDTPEMRTFLELYESVDGAPERVAGARREPAVVAE